MASSLESKTSLNVLQIMLNDALVQTGKALRASRKEGPGNVTAANTSARYKIPETMRNFHSALDDLEQEIIRAKGVMQRDISRSRESKMRQVEPPESIEPQSKSPMVIDLDSSPPAPKTEPEEEPKSVKKTIAPFPDMGLDVSATTASASGDLSSQAPVASVDVEPKIETTIAAPVPAMTEGDLEQQPKAPITDSGVPGAPNAELNFTNMEFALAQPENGQQADAGAGERFDLTAFAAADGANDSLSLDGLVPQAAANNRGGSELISAQGDASGIQDQMNGTENNVTDEALDNLLDMDFSGADGTDFDFSMDGGNSFNELMTNHDGTFDTTMSQGGFDEDIFNFDKTDGA